MQRQMKRPCAPSAPRSGTPSGEQEVCSGGCRRACRCHWRTLNQLRLLQPPTLRVTDAQAGETVAAYRRAGVPCVVTGQSGWAAFSYHWLKRADQKQHKQRNATEQEEDDGDAAGKKRKMARSDEENACEKRHVCERNPSPITTATTTTADSPISSQDVASDDEQEVGEACCEEDEAPILSLEEGPFEVDVDALIDDIGNEKVPVITPDYDDTAPLKEFVSVRDYIRKAWCSKQRSWYLHQWQFPLSASARSVLCYRNSNLSVLGYNLLHMWYDSLMGDCPFQYIFMGRANTFSRLHRDKGGLMILIAPIVGEKEVIMVHREDTHRLYHCRADVYNPDFGEFPLTSFCRAWKVVLRPGDILVMPANTYHAARNLTPCLSYSRFHLDEVNLPLFLQSFLDVDEASMPQALMIWNMTCECMKVLEHATEQQRHVQAQIDRVKSAGASQTDSQPSEQRPEGGEKAADQEEQAGGEEVDLSYHPSPQVAYSVLCKLRHAIQAILHDRAVSDVCAITPSAEPSMDISTEEWLSLRKNVDATLHDYHFRHLPVAPPMYLISTNPTKPKGPKGVPIPLALTSDALDLEETEEDSSRHIELPSAQEREIVSNLTKGGVVRIARCRKMLTAKILDIVEMDAAFIHYEGWPRYFEEYRPLPQLRHLDEAPVESLKHLCIGMGVLAQWGSGNDSYRATTLAMYSGPLLRVRYPDLGPDWDQWVRPLHLSI